MQLLTLLKIIGIGYLGLLVVSIFLSTCLFISQDKNTESGDFSIIDYISMTVLSPFFMIYKTIVYIQNHWQDILASIFRLVKKIISFFKNLINQFFQLIYDWIIHPILRVIKWFWNKILAVAEWFWNKILAVAEWIWNKILAVVEWIWKRFCLIMRKLGKLCTRLIVRILRFLSDLFIFVWDWIIYPFFLFLKNRVVGFWNTLVWLWNGIYRYILYPIYNFFYQIYCQFCNLCNYVYNLFWKAWCAFCSLCTRSWNAFCSLCDRLWTSFYIRCNRIWSMFGNRMSQLSNKILELWGLLNQQYDKAYRRFLNLWG